MTLGDVQRFAPLFDAGVLQPPRWLPDWVSRANGLAGMLAFSLFANRIRLDRVSEAPGFDICPAHRGSGGEPSLAQARPRAALLTDPGHPGHDLTARPPKLATTPEPAFDLETSWAGARADP